MPRSGYDDDCDGRELALWRGAVASTIRGKRGQEFLRELLAALDAIPEKRLIANALERDGEVCALGALGRKRGLAMDNYDEEMCDPETDEYRRALAHLFGTAPALVAEITYMNDQWPSSLSTPETRYQMVREWVASQIKETS
jgi:hypothetical protein